MSWISNVVRPKIRSLLNKREVAQNLWIKCPETGEMVFHRDLEANQFVIPGSGYHMRMTTQQRLDHFFDGSQYEQLVLPDVPVDPLKFRDERRYTERLRDARAKTGAADAVQVATGAVESVPVVAAVQDFAFIGGSLGMAAGEAMITGMMTAVERKQPFVLFAASGGARMQEGVFSLMQLPRTTVAVEMLKDAKLPYIVVLTNPTMGGVTASYAMLGDVRTDHPREAARGLPAVRVPPRARHGRSRRSPPQGARDGRPPLPPARQSREHTGFAGAGGTGDRVESSRRWIVQAPSSSAC